MMSETDLIDLYLNDLHEALGGRKGKAHKMMTRAIEQFGYGSLDVSDESVLVWSDLHIGHTNVIGYCDRPFHSVDEMNAALWTNWQLGAERSETLVCVGDAFFGLENAQKPLPKSVRNVLVVGNHDLTKGGNLRPTGFDYVKAILISEGDPNLIFTHAPLPAVPEGFVNVHGHTHTHIRSVESQHINVSVEQIDYRPIELSRLRQLAREIHLGVFVDGDTTLDRVRNSEMALSQQRRESGLES